MIIACKSRSGGVGTYVYNNLQEVGSDLLFVRFTLVLVTYYFTL